MDLPVLFMDLPVLIMDLPVLIMDLPVLIMDLPVLFMDPPGRHCVREQLVSTTSRHEVFSSRCDPSAAAAASAGEAQQLPRRDVETVSDPVRFGGSRPRRR